MALRSQSKIMKYRSYCRVRRFFEKKRKLKSSKKPRKNRVNRFFTMRLNLQLKACMMLLAKDFSLIYKSISVPVNHKIRFESTQPKTHCQACQLFQASVVLVPVLTCPSFDPLSRSSSFKFGFPVFYY